MRTKMGFGIAVLGVIVLLASFVSLIYGLTHSHAEASVTSKQGEYVVTDAGVLDLINVEGRVMVQAAEKDATVSLAIGTSEDVNAWSQGLPVFEVTGLKDWKTFASKERQAEVEDTPEVLGSDLWLYEKGGKGKVFIDYEVENPGNTSFIAHSNEASPLIVTVTWKRPHVFLSTLPYITIGGLLVAIGIVLGLIGLREGEKSSIGCFNSLLAKFQGKKRVKPIDISDLDISVPSREELVEQDRDQQLHNTGGVLGAGIIPVVDEEFREDTTEFPSRAQSRNGEENGKDDDDEA